MAISIRPALGPVKWAVLMLLLALLGFALGVWLNQRLGASAGPPQPIAFSHQLHAGDNRIPCQHCHIYARRSIVAGVPSVARCINCHNGIASRTPELEKLFGYWQRGEPIPWVKVHDLPDFVYFSHKRHVRAGLDCQLCHGPVETMVRVARRQSLQMGWCLSCHRQREVEHGTDCWTCHK